MGGLLTPLILASASPQRKTLLKKLGRPFTIVPSRVPETSRERDPRKLVKDLARRKAVAVAKRHPDALVLGADTVVFCRGRVITKPEDRADSLRILNDLNGRWQKVVTGVAVAWDGGRRVVVSDSVSRCRARTLGAEQLRKLAGKHMDKAGAYAVQDRRDPFIRKVEGRKDNVIGLPLDVVRRLLRRALSAQRARPARPARSRQAA